MTGCSESVVLLHRGDEVEQTDKLLTNQVFIIEREVFYDAEDDGASQNACIEQMNSIFG